VTPSTPRTHTHAKLLILYFFVSFLHLVFKIISHKPLEKFEIPYLSLKKLQFLLCHHFIFFPGHHRRLISMKRQPTEFYNTNFARIFYLALLSAFPCKLHRLLPSPVFPPNLILSPPLLFQSHGLQAARARAHRERKIPKPVRSRLLHGRLYQHRPGRRRGGTKGDGSLPPARIPASQWDSIGRWNGCRLCGRDAAGNSWAPCM
jgi:hypothetical protein